HKSFYDVDGVQGLLLRPFDPGAVGRPQPDLELSAIDFGQYVFTDVLQEQEGSARGEDKVYRNDRFAIGHDPVYKRQETHPDPVKNRRLAVLAMRLKQHF